mmetsp:Transcript_2684/g.7356  ORF Transcript_2684/g.7356 Transcript_2684/m.7356 type:complete len:336 (+) Transcript_2684:291-1298(+)
MTTTTTTTTSAEDGKETDNTAAGPSLSSSTGGGGDNGDDADAAKATTTITTGAERGAAEEPNDDRGDGEEGGGGSDGGATAPPAKDEAAAAASALSSTTTTTATELPRRAPPPPRKRARTAYFVFADRVRSTVRAEHPGEGVAAQAKRIGALWNAMSDGEKDGYKAIAAEEKEAVAAWRRLHPDPRGELEGTEGDPSATADGTDLVFPVGRIRKIAKLDPEVKALSKEALNLVVKTAELFLARLGKEASGVARMENRRTLLADDVAVVCTQREAFRFLKDDVRDLTRALRKRKEGGGGEEAAALTSSKRSSSTETARMAAAAGSKPLTSYFGAKK